jgi:hypothetical protein
MDITVVERFKLEIETAVCGLISEGNAFSISNVVWGLYCSLAKQDVTVDEIGDVSGVLYDQLKLDGDSFKIECYNACLSQLLIVHSKKVFIAFKKPKLTTPPTVTQNIGNGSIPDEFLPTKVIDVTWLNDVGWKENLEDDG